jgi:transcriptional regulator with XRE-family HTH domain
MPRPARTSRKPPPAAAMVKGWLAEQGRTQEWLAGALGVGLSAVWAWLSGQSAPILETATVLERLSNGAVPATAWADPRVVAKRVSHATAHE